MLLRVCVLSYLPSRILDDLIIYRHIFTKISPQAPCDGSSASDSAVKQLCVLPRSGLKGNVASQLLSTEVEHFKVPGEERSAKLSRSCVVPDSKQG